MGWSKAVFKDHRINEIILATHFSRNPSILNMEPVHCNEVLHGNWREWQRGLKTSISFSGMLIKCPPNHKDSGGSMSWGGEELHMLERAEHWTEHLYLIQVSHCIIRSAVFISCLYLFTSELQIIKQSLRGSGERRHDAAIPTGWMSAGKGLIHIIFLWT